MNGFTDSDNESPAKIFTEKCCLIDEGVRCGNVAGNASYSKRIQKTVTQRKLKLTIDPLARHIYICDLHKVRIQNARTKRTRKDSDDDEETDNDLFPQDVDLYQLQVNTLRRYKRHYKIATRPGMNKAQLADTIMKHFKTIQLKEKEVIQYFLYMVKTNSNKIDQKNGSSNVSMNEN